MNTTRQLELLEKSKSFKDRIGGTIQAEKPEILQLNISRMCNLYCKHCHVKGSIENNEYMSKKILEKCLEIAKIKSINTIDITGGSPEMNPHLTWLIDNVSKLDKRLIVRSNLVILNEEEYKKYIDIYVKYKVELCGSFPDINEKKFNMQRGKNSFKIAVEIIKKLNEKGYAKKGTGLILNLVHNPVGAYLPGPQSSLEYEYKRQLKEKYGIVFNDLFCITNMPIGRYLEYLIKSGNYEDYMNDLICAYNPATVGNLMCKTTLSVAFDGTIYDCDFNQMLKLPIKIGLSILDVKIDDLKKRDIILHNHCWGCTAGSGSSCQGEIKE